VNNLINIGYLKFNRFKCFP